MKLQNNKVEYRSMVSQNEIKWTGHPKYIEYLKTHFIPFCETSEPYPTLLLKIFHLAPSPLSLQLSVPEIVYYFCLKFALFNQRGDE